MKLDPRNVYRGGSFSSGRYSRSLGSKSLAATRDYGGGKTSNRLNELGFRTFLDPRKERRQ